MGVIGSSSFGALMVDGYSLLSAKVKGFSDEVEVELEQTDGLGDSWHEFLPTGMRKVVLAQDGAFFNTSTAAIHAAMKDATASSRLIGWAPAGNTLGAIFKAAQGAYSMKYKVLSTSAKLTKADVGYAVSGSLEEGVILQPWTALTATGNGTSHDYTTDPSQTVIPITSNSIANPSVVTTTVPHGLTTGDIILISGVSTSSPTINGQRAVTVISTTTFSVPVNVTVAGTGGSFVRANSTGGAVGYQFASDLATITGFVGKIQHSTDDSIWSDLITFTNVTATPAKERLTVAGTINRYTRFIRTVSGSGSIKPFVGLKRS
jgi:hypothetical protein